MRSRGRDDLGGNWLPADVFEPLLPKIKQLDIDQRYTQAILDHILDTGQVAVFKAVNTSDFIHKLLETTPSIPEHQRAKLMAIADELIELSRQVPKQAYERWMESVHEPAAEPAPHSSWDGWKRHANHEVDELKREWTQFVRWMREH